MDTEKLLPSQTFGIDNITIMDFNEEEMQIIQSYVEITRHIQEIHQLFEVFRYNLERLLHVYELNNADSIKRKVPYLEEFDDRIELNALVINYISSGKTLTDSIETCIKHNYSNDEKRCNSFSKFLSAKYDDCFSYRLLTRLRDFSQHGHLPVSVRDDSMCFDIGQIMDTPHFNHNKTILKEMKRFKDELLTIAESQPQYVFTLAIAEYTVVMCNIYYNFWLTLEEIFLSKEKDIRTLIKQNPSCIIHEDRNLKNWLFYLVDNVLHTFNTAEDSLSMFAKNMEEAKRISESEEKELNVFRRSIGTVKLVNK